MKTYSYLPVLLLLFLLSCSGKKSEDQYEEARKIYSESIIVHDEVMPKMGKIMNLQRSLNSKKENMSDEEILIKIDSTVQNLDEAHNAMMQWMRNLPRVPEKTDSLENIQPEEMIEIQKESLAKIREVKNKINTSINDAETLLENLNN